MTYILHFTRTKILFGFKIKATHEYNTAGDILLDSAEDLRDKLKLLIKEKISWIIPNRTFNGIWKCYKKVRERYSFTKI